METIDLATFQVRHGAALRADPVRHNVALACLEMVRRASNPQAARLWSFAPDGGRCALALPTHNIVLCDVEQGDCEALAAGTLGNGHKGVVGPHETAAWFVAAATTAGDRYAPPMRQMIHRLEGAPRYPECPGEARIAGPDDLDRVHEWIHAFGREAVPGDTPPLRENVLVRIGEGRFMLWIVDGEPVSLCGIARHVPGATALAPVYTPPELRGRGYAGAVTAASSERAHADGGGEVCLYTDLANPASNRCYARIGFVPYCPARHYWRQSSRNE
ncbi:MAG: GNAT family N-acetyltransferase [Rhizobiales bacterium]|nr:GNAT family N-acetyltransferase [Hyphomicrobiales bacterium]